MLGGMAVVNAVLQQSLRVNLDERLTHLGSTDEKKWKVHLSRQSTLKFVLTWNADHRKSSVRRSLHRQSEALDREGHRQLVRRSLDLDTWYD